MENMNSRSRLAKINRRDLFGLSTVALASMSQSAHAQVFIEQITQRDLEALKLKSDGITLDFPRLADTGSSVPLQVTVVAPAGLTIKSIDVYLPENPSTRALALRLLEPQARYAFTARLRLAASQEAWVVASLSDGSRIGASAPTIITSSACFDAS